MTHTEKAEAVLLLAIRQATKGKEMASGPLIREHVESCLSTALATCKEDRYDMYKLIDEARVLDRQETK